MPDFLRRFGQQKSDGTYYFCKLPSFRIKPLSTPETHTTPATVRSGLIVALLSIGTLFGALLGSPIADRIGRKKAISFWCLIVSIGFVVQIAAVTAW